MNKELKERMKQFIRLVLDDQYNAFEGDREEGERLIELLSRKQGRQPGVKLVKKQHQPQLEGQTLANTD